MWVTERELLSVGSGLASAASLVLPMDIAEKKNVVADFLRKCNRYADAELAKYRGKLETATGRDALALQDKIVHWTAYRTFNEHALGELAGNDLDEWFA